MFSDTVSGSVFLLAVAIAWRDLPQDRRDESDPLKMWDGISNQMQQTYLNSARRLRSALVEVEDAWDPRVVEEDEAWQTTG